MIKVGDILQRGIRFYRVLNVGRDVVMNRILYNPKTNRLQIYHGLEYAELSEIGTLYNVLKAEDTDTVAKLEIIKRKYKLEKLNSIDVS